jgi:hypothetical protein
VTREALEEMRRDGESLALRDEFRRSGAAVQRWERAHPGGLDAVLEWIEQLRHLLGDPEVGLEPWRGDDFRL